MSAVPAQKAPAETAAEAKNCPECNGNNLYDDKDSGERLCKDCGLIISEHIPAEGFKGEARRFPGEDADKIRTGPHSTFTIHDKGLSTIVGRSNEYSRGKMLTREKMTEIYNLKKWQQKSRVQGSYERSLAVGLSKINKAGERLNLPQIIREDVSLAFSVALKVGILQGRSADSLIGALYYLFCHLSEEGNELKAYQSCKTTRREREIAKAVGAKWKLMRITYKYLRDESPDFAEWFGKRYGEMSKRVKITDSKLYLNRVVDKIFADKTYLSQMDKTKVERMGSKVLDGAKQARLGQGRDPMSIAAAALYISCKLTDTHIIQEDIAEKADITEVTIRNRYKEMKERLFIECPL